MSPGKRSREERHTYAREGEYVDGNFHGNMRLYYLQLETVAIKYRKALLKNPKPIIKILSTTLYQMYLYLKPQNLDVYDIKLCSPVRGQRVRLGSGVMLAHRGE